VDVDPELLEDGGMYETRDGTMLQLAITDGGLVWSVVDDQGGDNSRRSLLTSHNTAGTEQTTVLSSGGEIQVSGTWKEISQGCQCAADPLC
jgi:hypothetical protein